MYRRMIGIFIPKHHYEAMKSEYSLHPAYAQYESTAEFYQLSVCFLCSDCTLSSNNIHVLLRDTENDKFKETMIPIPKVVYNRAHLNNKKVRQTLFYFIQSGSKVFNYIPIMNSKYFVHQLLEKEEHLIRYLPTTLKGTGKNLEYVLQHMENFFVKPCYSSIGKGIMNIQKEVDGHWYLYKKHTTKKSWEKSLFNSVEINRIKRLFKQHPFIIQERIPLATFQNRPFDLRVVVQKDGTGKWIISGIVAKLAPEGHVITNVARGGKIGLLQDYFTHDGISIQDIQKNINTLGVDIAKALEKNWPHIADLGLDIGITESGTLYFIECNLRGQYGAFRKIKDYLPFWEKTHDIPIEYANYLMNQIE
ncbi:YheC/YheD family protein [Bacillus sp. J37]|uniref:YheC/YheD family protein n=1 Tax=Bacillus sp. J37 TaxID=935837 RepID=UPI00047C006A|nr:YheC/YheD family protein [Bacillus sp. J37]